jgi:hypothetical protein
VVDGRWIVDPDNPGDDSKGSPLVLVERPAGMMLLTQAPEEELAAPTLQPWFRYIGQFRWNPPESEDFADDHVANLGLEIQREKLRGRAVLQWSNGRWERYDRSGGVFFDRGYIGTQVGGLDMDAFTDDGVVWTSSDPITLVGKLGVFDYNAGYGRDGLSVDYRVADAIHVRGLYADHRGELSKQQPAVPVSDLTAAASGADTTAYATDENPADSDVLAYQVGIETDDFQVGVVSRRNYGLYPGTMAQVSFADSAAVVYDTRQDTDARFYWLRVSKFFGVGAAAGYGRAHAEFHQLTREDQPLYPPHDLVATQRSAETNVALKFETSDRFYAGLDYAAGRATAKGQWDRTTFDFNGVVYEASEATVDRLTFEFDWEETEWTASGRLRYTNQDYGNTPPALLVDSPVLNPWLDWRDEFDVADIVGIGEEAYTDLTIDASWYPRRTADVDTTRGYGPRTWPEGAQWAPPLARLQLGTTAMGFFEAMRYNRARLSLAWVFEGRIYAMADGRIASYDIPAWGDGETFASGYVEAGYLHRWFNVSLGWGFDPVVFDPVVSDYMDIGRTEVLRQSLDDGASRDRADEIGGRLLSLERSLRNVQTIKLEVVVYF